MDKLRQLKDVPREWRKCKTDAERQRFLKQLWRDYKTVFWYVFFGFFTTVINVVIYAILMAVLPFDDLTKNTVSNVVAWVAAVSFAYVTNRKWVFESEHNTRKEILGEIFAFFVARGATGLLDLGIMLFTVNLLGWSDILMKVISNIIVIVLNFVLSKWVVFVKRKSSAKKQG